MASSLGFVTSEKAFLDEVAASSEQRIHQTPDLLISHRIYDESHNYRFELKVIGSRAGILTKAGKPTLKQDLSPRPRAWLVKMRVELLPPNDTLTSCTCCRLDIPEDAF